MQFRSTPYDLACGCISRTILSPPAHLPHLLPPAIDSASSSALPSFVVSPRWLLHCRYRQAQHLRVSHCFILVCSKPDLSSQIDPAPSLSLSIWDPSTWRARAGRAPLNWGDAAANTRLARTPPSPVPRFQPPPFPACDLPAVESCRASRSVSRRRSRQRRRSSSHAAC